MRYTKDDLRANDGAQGAVSISLNGVVICQYVKQSDGRIVVGYLDESIAAPMRHRNIAWYPVEEALVDQLLTVLNTIPSVPESDSAP